MPSKTLEEAEDAIRRRFTSEGVLDPLQYDAAKVVETERWWFIPCGWIGCAGCIVNKSDLYVNWLGSALSLDLCVWGHERGLFHDAVDFSFAPDTDLELAGRLLRRFKRGLPRSAAPQGNSFVWYGQTEIDAALSASFPDFRQHFVWYAIPELRDAYENEGLRFTSTLANVA
jgi:hypothetical protein